VMQQHPSPYLFSSTQFFKPFDVQQLCQVSHPRHIFLEAKSETIPYMSGVAISPNKIRNEKYQDTCWKQNHTQVTYIRSKICI
jgi:hypothetical protein